MSKAKRKRRSQSKPMSDFTKAGIALAVVGVLAVAASGVGEPLEADAASSSKPAATTKTKSATKSSSSKKPSASGCNKGRLMREDEKELARRCYMPLIEKYGKGHEGTKYGNWSTKWAFEIMWCESKAWPDAHNPQTVYQNGKRLGNAKGLFQILDGPSNPEANVKLAAQMYAARGKQPWECKA